jgi:DNA replication licensing factor MCM2
VDDEEVFEPMSAAARRAAEAKMRQRDRMERGSRRGMRAANRSHAPSFLDSDDVDAEDDDESGLLSGTRTRARRQYDERRDVDDMEGIEDVCSPFCPRVVFCVLTL